MDKYQIVYKLFNYGFFPEDLPPEFLISGGSIEFLYKFLNSIDEFDILGKGRKTSEPIQFTVPKNNHTRRWFHLLHPLHFIRLSNTIADNWEEIHAFCMKSEYSTSKITFSEEFEKLFQKGPFRESVRERINRSAGKKHLLVMDITSFYPSIYTHCLEWIFEGRRLNGKERFDRSFVGVALDQDIRNSQSGKTNGIVIGPETSRIISEIVGAYLDSKISALSIDFSGTRYVDDYHLYFNNLSDLEQVRITLQSELNKLNLASNEAKSDVKIVPEIFEQPWVQEFSKIKFRKTEIGIQKDLISLFSSAIGNSQHNTKDYSLKFLISMLLNKKINLTENSKELLLELIRHAIEQDSRVTSRAFKLLYKTDSFCDKMKFEQLFREKLITDSRLGKSFEVIWILNGYQKLEIIVPDDVINYSIEQSDILVLSYLMFLSEKELISEDNIEKIYNYLKECIDDVQEPFLSNYWLILYEGIKRKWFDFGIPIPAYIEIMLEHNISFLSDSEYDWSDIQISNYPEIDFDETENEEPY
jgi:hypothetical protein